MIQKLMKIFCKHDYVIPKEYDDHDERNQLVSELKEGEMITFNRMHHCEKCNDVQMISSGIIC